MQAVLLRMSRLDALDCDAEAQPPDRKFGEIEEGVGTGEGNAIIRADGFRQAALLKSRSKAMTAGSSRVGIDTSKGKSVTHVSGTNCHLFLGPLTPGNFAGLRRAINFPS